MTLVEAWPLPASTADDVGLELKKVLAGMREVRLALQPVVELDHGEVVGYEALARFGPGHRSPGPFFAAADELQRRPELEALLDQQALDLRADVPAGRFLAVNVSPALLAAGPVWSALAAAGDLDGLVIELTEHTPVDNLSRLRRRLDTLRSSGAVLALDDVGAGWSGLQQVVDLRPDIVKLDRSLVARLHEDPARHAVAELLGAFTEKVGGQLLAEGVERIEELTSLLELNVHLAQGWLLGRPQFGWPEIPAATSALLAAGTRAERQVGSLAVPVDAVPNVAAVGFLGAELPIAALLTDPTGAVTALWVRNQSAAGPSGWARPATTLLATTPLARALRQAMARPPAERFDPLVCVDGVVVLGLVHLDALVCALA
jgi:EAL domain-containing protein (putative c-di-GMP-specific phosphodiesterase class I)